MVELSYVEIDGTVTKIRATQADEGFLHFPAGSIEACNAKGLHLYKGETGEYYLADEQGNIAATGTTMIGTYIRMILVK